MTYIQGLPRDENAFAQWGSHCHKVIERYYKRELELFELSDEYQQYYDERVTAEFPENPHTDLSLLYKNSGQTYFDEFDDLFLDCEVLAVEKEFETKIGDFKFVGVIDLILKSGDDFWICDHKSKSGFKSESEKRYYLFQLYLYSKYVYETFGKYPSRLIYNMFRKRDVIAVDFDESEYYKALSWAENTIKQIYEEEDFVDKIETKILSSRGKKRLSEFKRDDFFCNELCNVRSQCERSNKCQVE